MWYRRLFTALLCTVLFCVCMIILDARYTIYSGSSMPVASSQVSPIINQMSNHTQPQKYMNFYETPHNSHQIHNIVNDSEHPTTETPSNPLNHSIDSWSANATGLPLLISNSTNSKPLRLLLLSYQRSGSSIISSLFGDDPNIFFLFEPLDAVYSALYGTSPGWSVPSDITISKNGKLREMPQLEKEAVQSFMQSVFSCDFDHLPKEYFIHPFWWYFEKWGRRVHPFTKCLKAHGLTQTSLSLIQRKLLLTCGRRFGDSRNSQGKCFGHMWPKSLLQTNSPNFSSIFKDLFRPSRDKPLEYYAANLEKLGQKAGYCVKKYLTESCKQTPYRAMKTVRATMEETETLLKNDPHFKVVHLLRDPRGVTRSRNKATWSRGFYDSRDVGKVAQSYCTTALRDYKVHEELDKKYPGRIKQIVLEGFLKHPADELKDLFTFLGIQAQPTTLHQFQKKMVKGFADKWKTDLKENVISTINSKCSELMRVLRIPAAP